jgi:hypothetical protein
MEITKEIKEKVFGQYIGNLITWGEADFKGDKIHTILLNSQTINNIFNMDTKLILKPLSAITDEDMVWVYDTCNNLHEQRRIRPDWVKQNTPSLKDMKRQINNGHAHYKGGYLSDSAVHQYLLSKGYDLPQYLLGWKTLHESGLAVYE